MITWTVEDEERVLRKRAAAAWARSAGRDRRRGLDRAIAAAGRHLAGTPVWEEQGFSDAANIYGILLGTRARLARRGLEDRYELPLV